MDNKAVTARGLKSGFFDQEAFIRKRSLVLVLGTDVAGLKYHVDLGSDEGETFIDSLTPGTELTLCREPDNRHDKWAIAIYTADGVRLGYVRMGKNETVARLMDLGRSFICIVDGIRRFPHAPEEQPRIELSVYMEE